MMKKSVVLFAAIIIPLWAQATGNFDAVLKRNFTAPSVPVSQSRGKPGAARISEVYPTFFFVEGEGKLFQLVRLELLGTGRSLVVRAERPGGLVYDNPVGLQSDAIIKVPDLRENAELKLTLLDSGRELQSLKFSWRPARLWKIYVSFVSHLDIGYTNTTENVLKKRTEITERALEYMNQTDAWPEDSRFRWTMEGAWELKHFLEQRPERLEEVRQRAQQGRLEVTAKLVHMHSETAGYEELFREVYYGKREVEALLGVQSPAIMHNDVDGFTWGEVSVLSSSGIKYFSFNPNSFYRGGNVLHATKFPQAFFWQGPDGGRLLTWRSKDAYTEAPYLFKGYDQTLSGLTKLLASYEQKGYGYDAIHLTRSGADPNGANDNSWPRLEACETIREWNSHFAYPRLLSSTPTPFFAYLEKNFSGQIPAARGDMPDWWADGVITEAAAEAESRELHHKLFALEALSSMADLLIPGYSYPAREINQAYFNNIMFDEHTWGYFLTTAPQHKEIFKLKHSWLEQALEASRKLEDDVLKTLAREIAGPGPSLVVMNPLSWPRSELVSFQASEIDSEYLRLIDPDSGRELPLQMEAGPGGKILYYFLARELPAMGYKSYQIVAAKTRPEYAGGLKTGEDFMENERYVLRFDKKLGLVSIRDKSLQRELLQGPAGQFIFRKQDRLTDWIDLRKTGKVESLTISSGPVFATARLIIRDPGNQKARLTQSITLYAGLPWIDISLQLENFSNRSCESRYLAFPLAVPDFETWVETPYSRMRPYHEQLPDFAKFYTVAHSIELKSKSENFSIVWSTREAPMVELGEITKLASWTSQMFWPLYYRAGKYPWNPASPAIYSEIMNNFQNTNFSASQKGDALFRYRLQALSGAEAGLVHRSGWELSAPALVRVQPSGSAALPKSASFCKLSPGNVMLTAFKKAEDGDGYIIRLYEAEGQATTATIEFPLFKIKEAWLTDGVEREQEKIITDGKKFTIELKGLEVKTIKIAPELITRSAK